MRLLLFFFLLASCTGYRFTQQDNPLSQYGIQSLSVPMFYNYSNLGDVSGDFTRETYRLLMSFSGLKLHSGYDKNSDAVLIGIIKSPERVFESMRPTGSPIVVQDKVENAVGDRDKFYVPSTTQMNLSLHVIVIKKPSEEELALLKSGIGDQIKLTSKIIFNEILPLNTQFTRVIMDADAQGSREGGVNVIATQNAGLERKSIKNLSEQAAISIRDMILYAF